MDNYSIKADGRSAEREKADGDKLSRGARFKALIEGEYKDEFAALLEKALEERALSASSAENGDSAARLTALLEKRYGTLPGDAAALLAAVEKDDPETRRAESETRRENCARRLYDAWLRESAHFRAAHHDFDLASELDNADFRELLRSGASVKAAYELTHREEIMRSLARDMEQKLMRRLLSGADRPREEGLSERSAAVVKPDVAQMSKGARREIIARVARGERISF